MKMERRKVGTGVRCAKCRAWITKGHNAPHIEGVGPIHEKCFQISWGELSMDDIQRGFRDAEEGNHG